MITMRFLGRQVWKLLPKRHSCFPRSWKSWDRPYQRKEYILSLKTRWPKKSQSSWVQTRSLESFEMSQSLQLLYEKTPRGQLVFLWTCEKFYLISLDWRIRELLQMMKDGFNGDTVLAVPSVEYPFHIHMDSSNVGLVSDLIQHFLRKDTESVLQLSSLRQNWTKQVNSPQGTLWDCLSIAHLWALHHRIFFLNSLVL